ncbi:MAG: nucleotidyltransferase domain-containing protein [Sedimentisphaerales bacterium]|nr:nucleotidyltransferase domain-containing protein [Sedimentisphaerales bacterium]
MTQKDKTTEIAKQLKKAVEDKYNIIEMKLFGSFARGDYSKTSDIDLMVVLAKVDRDIEEDLFNLAYDLELQYDCVIDVIVLPQDFNNSIPIYRNIQKEGIAV